MKSALARRRWSSLLLVAAVLLAYCNVFQGSFQFDDYAVIVDNPAVASWAAWWQSMPGIRPLLKLSYTLNRQLPDAWLLAGFHAVNIAIHAGNALLLYGLVRRVFAQDAAPDSAEYGALLAALLFALHPVNTEAVSLISGRSMALMSLFYLSSLVLYLERRIVLSLMAWALALMVRETALTLPLALLLLERHRGAVSRAAVPFAWRALRPYVLFGLVAVVLMAALPYYRHLAAVSLGARPLADNLISQSGAVIYLLRQWLWPLTLNADPVLPVFQDWTWIWVSSVASCLVALFWAVRVWWLAPARSPLSSSSSTTRWFAFAVLWFAVHLAPTNSLLPRLDLANERQLYIAAMGGCVLFGWIGACSLRRWPKPSRALLGVLLLALALLTYQRNAVYRDEVSFWRDVTHKSPTNARAWNNLGYALTLQGQPADAFSAYAQALDLQPDDFRARLNQRALCREHSAHSSELMRQCAGRVGLP